MAAKILSEDDMAEARRLYEREGLGYSRLAFRFSVTKATAQSWVRRGNWQRDAGVLPMQKGEKKAQGDGDSLAKLTGMPVSGSRADGMHTAESAESSGQVGDIYRAPALLAPAPAAGGAVGLSPTPSHESAVFKIAEPPPDLGIIERLDWVRREFNVLEQKMGDRHETERRALQNDFAVEMTKGVRTDRGPSLRLKALTEALAARQDMQKAALGEYCETRLREYAGVYSSSLIIVAVPTPGFSFSGSNSTFAIARRTRDAADFYSEAAAQAEAAADAENVDWRDVPERAEPEEPLTVDVDAVEVAGEPTGTVYAPSEEGPTHG